MYLGFSLGTALGSIVITLTSIVWVGAAGAACTPFAMTASAFAWRSNRA
jgi:predicted MFS family arabinose efflux permease